MPTGTHQDFTVTLDPGHYVLLCNKPGHYQQAMYLNVTVEPNPEATARATAEATMFMTEVATSEVTAIPTTEATSEVTVTPIAEATS